MTMEQQKNPYPTVSVITPSYNQGAFIEETIRSVLSQQGDFFLDYLIIDGGSADRTLEIVRAYDRQVSESRLPISCKGVNFRWMSEKDHGQADAIAKGFALAKGDILAWLNSDDIYYAGAIDRALRVFRENNHVDVVYGRGVYLDESGNEIGWYPTEPFDRKRLAISDFVCQPSTFFTRTVYDRCGGVDIDLHYAMDYDLWIRMAARGNFLYLPDSLSGYRLHGDSKTVSPSHAFENHKECLQTVLRHYRWAPINRVIGYLYHGAKKKMPAFLAEVPAMALIISSPCALGYYLWLNKGFRWDDFRLMTPTNIRKLWSLETAGR